jgi:hypothetical protein
MKVDDAWFGHAVADVDLGRLRADVRTFLREERQAGLWTPRVNAWLEGHDPAFTRRLAARGWLGMTWPKEYGGHARSGIERFVVIEELLAAGAPVAAHWTADRQTGPSLLKYGTLRQRQRFLPAIGRGECFFAIGMSEPDSGSDLASVRTRATPDEGGWRVTGTKVWTSHADKSHYFVALCRTTTDAESRHAGLSQFIIDLRSPGVTIRPIRTLGDVEHFAEVNLDDVFVPDDMVLGDVGSGWQQVTAELAHERSGPERFLSTYPLLSAFEAQTDPGERTLESLSDLGIMIADVWALHAMSQSIAVELDHGAAPKAEAALVKDLGTAWEQHVVEVVGSLLEADPMGPPEDSIDTLLAQAIHGAPGFTLRGGTTEILRGIIAKELTG